VKGQPSFLEKLASAELVSSEDMPELWREFVLQATDSPLELGRESFTEYEFDSDEPLSRKAERAKKAHEAALVEIYKELKTKDPEVATAALDIWDDVADVAEFLATPSKILNGQMPLGAYRRWAQGRSLDADKRNKVRISDVRCVQSSTCLG